MSICGDTRPSSENSMLAMVDVTANAHDYSSKAIQFTYLESAKDLHISPHSGPSTGGTTLLLTSSNIAINVINTDDLRCRFQDVSRSLVERPLLGEPGRTIVVKGEKISSGVGVQCQTP